MFTTYFSMLFASQIGASRIEFKLFIAKQRKRTVFMVALILHSYFR